MKIFVIGASGFVGKYLTKELESQNHSVIQGNFPQFDLLDKEKVEKIIKEEKPDAVVNLAAISSVGESWKNPIQTINVNVNGTLNLLNAVQKFSKDSKILLIGSAEEYGIKGSPVSEEDSLSANNPYGISKIAQENFANLYREKFGLKIICTRSFNHTGVGQSVNFVLPSFIKQVAEIEKTGKPGKIFVGNLNVYRDFSDVEDVVFAYRKLLEEKNEFCTYNIGSGIAYKLETLLREVIVKFASVPIDIEIDSQKLRPIDNPYLCADNKRIKPYWKGTEIEITLKKMFVYFMSNT